MLILICVLCVFGCRNPIKNPNPVDETPNIIEQSPDSSGQNGDFTQDDNLTQDNDNSAQENSEQLNDDEKPNTIEDYQKPTQPIVFEPPGSPKPELNDTDKAWQIKVAKEDIVRTLENMKIRVSSISPIIIDTKDEQGCCSIISIGGRLVNAYEFCRRLNLPSSYITGIEIDQDSVTFSGQGVFDSQGF
ncbi:MAG TPA: hypothetical protein VIL23_03465 [Clostridia bacterium]